MAADLERLSAAQAKADEVAAAIAEAPEPGRHLRVSFTDPETEQRLATVFVNYQTDGRPSLRLVTS
jgi:hypothetical protein